jgi:hypothetical protein
MPQAGVRLHKPTILQVAEPQELRYVIFRCHGKPSVDEDTPYKQIFTASNIGFSIWNLSPTYPRQSPRTDYLLDQLRQFG